MQIIFEKIFEKWKKGKIFMLYIQQSSNKTVTIDSRVYRTNEEFIGARPKFWIIGEKSPYNNSSYNYRNNNMLLKFNRNGLSCEDYGEVLYSSLLRANGVRCTEYQLAEYTDKKGEVIHGVACPSYKHSDKELDISGYDLQRFQHSLKNETSPDLPYNTVDSYIQCIKQCMNLPNATMLQYIEDDLIKIAFFDYICGHTDRHWDNISFVYNNHTVPNGNYEAIRVADCYDSGCSFMLNRKRAAIQTYANELKAAQRTNNTTKYESICKMLSDKSIPKFGITSSISEVVHHSDDDPEFPKMILATSDPNWEDTFLNELCSKIAHNPRLSTFIVSHRDTINIDTANTLALKEGNDIPDEILTVASAMVDSRLKTFDTYMFKYIDKINANDKDFNEFEPNNDSKEIN